MTKKIQCTLCGRKIAKQFMPLHMKKKHSQTPLTKQTNRLPDVEVALEKLRSVRDEYHVKLKTIETIIDELSKY